MHLLWDRAHNGEFLMFVSERNWVPETTDIKTWFLQGTPLEKDPDVHNNIYITVPNEFKDLVQESYERQYLD